MQVIIDHDTYLKLKADSELGLKVLEGKPVIQMFLTPYGSTIHRNLAIYNADEAIEVLKTEIVNMNKIIHNGDTLIFDLNNQIKKLEYENKHLKEKKPIKCWFR